MEYTELKLTIEDAAAILTFNRPDRSNAFNDTLTAEVLDALKQLARASDVRCVVLTGAGKNFCAGQDLGVIQERLDAPGGIQFQEHLNAGYNQIVLRLRSMEKPVIAAVNGAAAGAGLGIACACDIRYASENAKFRMAFIGIGLAPDSGTSFFLPRLIGWGRALEMAMTNQLVGAQDALAWGLVTKVLPPDELMPAAVELAKQLASASPRGLGLTKRAFNRALLTELERTLAYEAELQEIAGRSLDRAAIDRFISKASRSAG